MVTRRAVLNSVKKARKCRIPDIFPDLDIEEEVGHEEEVTTQGNFFCMFKCQTSIIRADDRISGQSYGMRAQRDYYGRKQSHVDAKFDK